MKSTAKVVKADYGDFGPKSGLGMFVTKSYAKGGKKVAKKAHPGFKAVQKQIAKKGGFGMERAGAILASSTRKASTKAKKANPRLKRVKGK